MSDWFHSSWRPGSRSGSRWRRPKLSWARTSGYPGRRPLGRPGRGGRDAQGKKPETEGRVVAELMWGFWRLLHSKVYEVNLWRPCLRHAYPQAATLIRDTVYEHLDHS